MKRPLIFAILILLLISPLAQAEKGAVEQDIKVVGTFSNIFSRQNNIIGPIDVTIEGTVKAAPGLVFEGVKNERYLNIGEARIFEFSIPAGSDFKHIDAVDITVTFSQPATRRFEIPGNTDPNIVTIFDWTEWNGNVYMMGVGGRESRTFQNGGKVALPFRMADVVPVNADYLTVQNSMAGFGILPKIRTWSENRNTGEVSKGWFVDFNSLSSPAVAIRLKERAGGSGSSGTTGTDTSQIPSTQTTDPSNWTVIAGGAVALSAAAVLIGKALKGKKAGNKKDSKDNKKEDPHSYILQLSANSVELSPGISKEVKISAWKVDSQGTNTPASEASIKIEDIPGVKITPGSGTGSLICRILPDKSVKPGDYQIQVTANANGKEVSTSLNLKVSPQDELELTYPAGKSPKVFTSGWIFGARCKLNTGTDNEKDVSELVKWSGTGQFEPDTGSTSRPDFSGEGANKIILKYEGEGRTITKEFTVMAVSSSRYARVGDKAQCPADAHGCPACPHPTIGPIISGSPTVLINGTPAARKGDAGVHSACCGPNRFTIAEGDSNVLIDGKPAARMGDRTQHCGGNGSIVGGSRE